MLPLAISVVDDYLVTMEKSPARTSTGARTQVKGLGVRRATRKVKFGNVVITSTTPDRKAVAANVERSSEALERVAKKLIRPGFAVRARQDVPRFSIDSTDPKLIIRELNGRTERGKLVNGQFEVVD
jgi:hypothetical protein